MAKTIDPALAERLRRESEQTKDDAYPADSAGRRPNRQKVYSVRLSAGEEARSKESQLPSICLPQHWSGRGSWSDSTENTPPDLPHIAACRRPRLESGPLPAGFRLENVGVQGGGPGVFVAVRAGGLDHLPPPDVRGGRPSCPCCPRAGRRGTPQACSRNRPRWSRAVTANRQRAIQQLARHTPRRGRSGRRRGSPRCGRASG